MSLKFKSPTNATLHVASTSGQACRVGPKWRDIPPGLVADAIRAGCVSNNMSDADMQAASAKVAGETHFDPKVVMREQIILMLEDDKHKDDNFTNAGPPNMSALSAKCGFNVDREVMLGVWHDLNDAADDADPKSDA